MGVWLEVRWTCHVDEFRQKLKDNPRACIARHYSGLEWIHRNRALENLKFVQHLKDNPQVYGKSTPEMIERFEKSAGESMEQAWLYVETQLAVLASQLPHSVLEYVPFHSDDEDAAHGQEMNHRTFGVKGPLEIAGESPSDISTIEEVMN
jgi:hypothetical protein